MKGGDYMIHVYIQEGHSFKYESQNTFSPMIEIETCGIKNYTKHFDDIPTNSKSHCIWREHVFFEPKAKVRYSLILIAVLETWGDFCGVNHYKDQEQGTSSAFPGRCFPDRYLENLLHGGSRARALVGRDEQSWGGGLLWGVCSFKVQCRSPGRRRQTNPTWWP